MNVLRGSISFPSGVQKALAKEMLISEGHLSQIKNGRRLPSTLAIEAWRPLTGWDARRWRKAKVSDIQKMLLRVAGEIGLIEREAA